MVVAGGRPDCSDPIRGGSRISVEKGGRRNGSPSKRQSEVERGCGEGLSWVGVVWFGLVCEVKLSGALLYYVWRDRY